MNAKELAVVIGYRDWGLDRLTVVVHKLAQSSIAEIMDIVVSDYGSVDDKNVQIAVNKAGGRVIRSERIGPWSRARALNAGVKGTNAHYVITTDSDMFFTPFAAENMLNLLKYDSSTVHLVQCRDLNSSYGVERVGMATSEELEENSFFRPRWGMGGLIAFRRTDFDRIRGYDERMLIYGGEDIDFAQRLRRTGLRLNWVDDVATRIYHIWHPSSQAAATEEPAQRDAVALNRDIMHNDVSWIRNISSAKSTTPVASVLIATRNRAQYLLDSIHSALAQTVQDIEIVIMDDGSTDETSDVLASIDDPRVRWMRQEPLGVAAARNKLVATARAPFIVVQDDDDIMLPWRIEKHLEALSADLAGTYGGWIDFDNETGDISIVHGREFDGSGFIYAAKIMAHGTTMFRTDVLRKYKYNEFLRAGVDYNLIVRLVYAGYRFRHTKNFHILRRMHNKNLTSVAMENQKNSATRIVHIIRHRNSHSMERQLREKSRNLEFVNCKHVDAVEEKILPFLPDHLVQRSVTIEHHPVGMREQIVKQFDHAKVLDEAGWADASLLTLVGLKHAELAALRKMKDVKYTIGPAHKNIVKDSENPEIQIQEALPSSGLLDTNTINVILISSESTQPERQDPPRDGVRTRFWSSWSSSHRVSSKNVNSVEEAISLMDSSELVSFMLFIPSYYRR